MNHSKFRTFFLVVLVLILISNLYSQGYDESLGIEYNDIVDLTFMKYINGTFENLYTVATPYQATINSSYINENFVDEIIGMKVGQNKSYISFYEKTDFIEIYDLYILRIIQSYTTTTDTTTVNAFDLEILVFSISILLYYFAIKTSFKKKKVKSI